jgi:hypothetical protein
LTPSGANENLRCRHKKYDTQTSEACITIRKDRHGEAWAHNDKCAYSCAQGPIATNPSASTREHAVVGVGGAPVRMRLRLRPSFLNVDRRGVDIVGNGTLDMFDVSVIVDGVVTDCSGGKTKRVWDGVGASTIPDDAEERLEGVEGMRSGVGAARKDFGCGFGFNSGSDGLAPTGDGGTGGRRGGGLRFLNLLGGADKLNDCFAAGAEGGGGNTPNVVLVCRAEGGGRNPNDCLVAGAVGGGRAVVGVKMDRGREDARASSSVASVLGDPLLLSAGLSSRVTMLSSSSSNRSSLRTLRFVKLLATDPARLRPLWPKRLFQAWPMPIPEPVEPTEAVVDCWEPFRATMRCSISKSRARASSISSTLSCSSSSAEASSSS